MEWQWEWEPEQQDLGALGLAGICRETSRVVRRAILPNFANLGPPLLSALLLANSVTCSALSSRVGVIASDPNLDAGTGLLCLVADGAACCLLDIVTFGLLLLCTAAYVLCVTSLYSTGGDLLAADRVLKEDLPDVRLTRLAFTYLLVAVLFLVAFSLTVAGALLWPEVETVLPLRLLEWASAAYVAVVWQLACVVSVLEDATLFSAVRRSRELLARKFWAAACVFVTLDGRIIAVVVAFRALVVDDALGLDLVFQVAAGAAMFFALRAVLVVALVAQPVVYMVCKSHHQQVADKSHLD